MYFELKLPMRKTDKKIDNQISSTLTDVCELALKEIDGFQWITHLVNYSNFPKSLKVVCIFDTNEKLSDFMLKNGNTELNSLIQLKLSQVVVKLGNVTNRISYDTEENCKNEHDGKWSNRFG
ncbi:MAG: hypothetical protein ACI9IA_000827 [Enterobacterales bacterium]|jgi:hypothetical protein